MEYEEILRFLELVRSSLYKMFLEIVGTLDFSLSCPLFNSLFSPDSCLNN